MTYANTINLPVTDVAILKPGDRIEEKYGNITHHRGVVDAVAPHLGVVWIVESQTGGRRMIDPEKFTVWLT